jgi:hypothetical protein
MSSLLTTFVITYQQSLSLEILDKKKPANKNIMLAVEWARFQSTRVVLVRVRGALSNSWHMAFVMYITFYVSKTG